MGLKIVVDGQDALGELEETPDALRRAVRNWLVMGAHLVRNEMVQVIGERTRSRSGLLADSVQVAHLADRAEIGPQVEYAVWVDQPTRPHTIVPVRAQALTLPLGGSGVGGVVRRRGGESVTVVRIGTTRGGRAHELTFGVVFAKRVEHPGTPGAKFVEATAQRVQRPLEDELDRQVDAELKRLKGGGP